MGEIAEKFADQLILTDDNPRNEQGDLIIEHIMSGMSDASVATIERDRAKAIKLAIGQAVQGDVVLIAGKGHETYQEVNGVRQIFSDANQVRLAMKERQV